MTAQAKDLGFKPGLSFLSFSIYMRNYIPNLPQACDEGNITRKSAKKFWDKSTPIDLDQTKQSL